MNNKTFATLMLIIGLFLLIAGAGIAISSMNQTIDSPFMTSANSVNSMWNTETAGIILGSNWISTNSHGNMDHFLKAIFI